MDIDEPATKPIGKTARKRRRKPKHMAQREQVCDVYLATLIGLVEDTNPYFRVTPSWIGWTLAWKKQCK